LKEAQRSCEKAIVIDPSNERADYSLSRPSAILAAEGELDLPRYLTGIFIAAIPATTQRAYRVVGVALACKILVTPG
jgi:hypothetical protein